jgi:hypothetical protein
MIEGGFFSTLGEEVFFEKSRSIRRGRGPR